MKILSAHVFVIAIASVASFVSSECLNHKMTNFVDFEIQCTRLENYGVKIMCHSNDWTQFPNVSLDLPYAALITFENCSFPSTINVQSLLQTMKVQSISRITFDKLQSIPNRQNFKAISAPHMKFFRGDFTELPFDLLYGVLNIRTLGIRYTEFVKIPTDFFSSWSKNIFEIAIVENNLQKIFRNDFSQLVNVNTIDLFGNEINEIESGAFDGLIHLDKLLLERNRLHTLPPGIFHQTIALTMINMDNNSFDDLPRNLLKSTKNLQEFSMKRNNGTLTTLPSDIFSGCYHLKVIDLRENQLTNLPSNLFNGNKNLQSLYIDDNHLESLPADIFKNLDQLKFLSISKNRLTSLVRVLNGLKSLFTLNASENNITQVDDEFLMYLKSADNINLSHNQLTFESKASSKTNKNQITQPFVLDPSIQLKTVYLNNNKIKKFDAGILNILKYSRYVDIGYNEISKINLTDFSLEMVFHNSTYYYNGFRISDYVNVILSNNPLHCDCQLVDFVRYLNDWHENKFYNIFAKTNVTCATPTKFKNQMVRNIPPEELDCMLKTTDQKDACTDTCICRKYPVRQVITVDCSNRNLTQIPNVIKNMPGWSIELNMTGNQLQQAPSLNNSHWTNIISLDLSNNNITKVPLDLFSPKLHHLRLHGNSLPRLDTKVIDYLSDKNTTLRSITLHDNKWICECETRRLLPFVQKRITRYSLHDMMCYGTDKKLYKLTVSELCEGVIVTMVTVCVIITILSILLGSLIAIYCKYQREIKVWLYSKHWCLWFVTEDELDKDKEYDAFISFSHEDEEFVEKEIVAKLEAGPKPYKLCLHYRDWLAGEWIPVQISRSVAESRRTIIILTPHFLESVWGLLEFRAAHTQALQERRTRLIVILCGEIGNINDLDKEMKDYLRLNTYIKWGDPWFWDKLRYALPHAKQISKNIPRSADLKNNSLQLPLVNGNVNTPDVNSILKSTALTSDSTNLLNTIIEDQRSTSNSCL